MTQAGVRGFLLLYFMVFFGAVFLRVDYFPLSWVPMYGFREERPTLTVAVGDLKRRDLGFAAERANGERLFVSRHDLNMPPANFRRLYHERAFGFGPPQHSRERAGLMRFNRWWYETFVGEDPIKNPHYAQDVLDSVNATLGYEAADPRRIVRLSAHLDFATYTRDQLDRGDLLHPRVQRRVSVITPTSVTVHGGSRS